LKGVEKMLPTKKFKFAIILFFVILFCGAYAYHLIEGWRYIDSLYFTIATTTTVGYGDFVPQTDIGKIFTMFFSFLGIGFVLYLFTLAGRYVYLTQLFSRLREEKKLGGSKGYKKIKV
jgi:hypothetical protein